MKCCSTPCEQIYIGRWLGLSDSINMVLPWKVWDHCMVFVYLVMKNLQLQTPKVVTILCVRCLNWLLLISDNHPGNWMVWAIWHHSIGSMWVVHFCIAVWKIEGWKLGLGLHSYIFLGPQPVINQFPGMVLLWFESRLDLGPFLSAVFSNDVSHICRMLKWEVFGRGVYWLF